MKLVPPERGLSLLSMNPQEGPICVYMHIYICICRYMLVCVCAGSHLYFCLCIPYTLLSSPPAVFGHSRRILKFIPRVKESKSQKVSFFAKSCTFRLFGQNSKSRTFRKKLHFSTFRAVFSPFNFSGKNQKVALFTKS